MAQQDDIVPPGWYPDPHGSPGWRWWDGGTWTHHVAPRIAAPPAPVAGFPVAPAHRAAPTDGLAALALQHSRRVPPVPQDLDARHGPGALDSVIFNLLFTAVMVFHLALGADAGAHTAVVFVITGVTVLPTLPKGWAALWRRWRILDTPTMDAAGARPGLCEIAGCAELLPGRPPLVSMLSGLQTIGYRAAVERLEGSKNNRHWAAQWTDDQAAPLRDGFLVRSDGGGAILVRVREPARVLRPTTRPILSRGGVRVCEYGLVPGDRVFCLGEVTMADDGTLVLDDPDIAVAGVERAVVRGMRGNIAGAVMAVVTIVIGLAYYVVGRRDGRGLNSVDLAGPLPTALTALGILALIAAVLLGVRWWNRVVAVREQVKAAWAHIEADLQRRHDTLGGLVTVVKEAAAHEGATLDVVVAARHQLRGSLHAGVPDDPRVQSIGAEVGAASAAEQAMIAVAERHPQLRTQATFTRLFEELAAAENRIAAARRFYNDAITLFDDRVDRLPGLLVWRWVLPQPRPALLQFAHAALPVVGHPWAVPPPPPGVPQAMEAARVPRPPAPAS